MNLKILFIALLIICIIASMGMRKITLRPGSSCTDFISGMDAILARPDLSTMDLKTRAEMCKIPRYQLKKGECKSYDWLQANNSLMCDTAAERGALTKRGVSVWA